MRFPRTNRSRLAIACLAAALWGSAALAKVDVTLDADTLNELLPAMAPKQVKVALTQGRAVTILLQNLRVTGFDPSEGGNQEGYILTSLLLKIPELNFEVPLEPRLSLQVDEKEGVKHAYLRFERVPLQLPLGTIDVAALLPRLPLLADTAWNLASSGGNVRVRTILKEARMGAKFLRLTFDVDAKPTS
jgi:hypothetical protein